MSRCKYKLSEREKRELGEHRGTGLSHRQLKAINREADKMREYIEFLGTL